nr:MAG TPA: hypothetical protein [Bacteriophage sp.]
MCLQCTCLFPTVLLLNHKRKYQLVKFYCNVYVYFGFWVLIR